MGRGKKQSFNYIRERIWQKIQGWKEKLLSQVGRKVLIKSILQAMPTFTMNCFKLPKNLCKDIELPFANFGEAIEVIRVKSIGWLGINFAFLNVKVVWDSVRSKILTLHSLGSRYGG